MFKLWLPLYNIIAVSFISWISKTFLNSLIIFVNKSWKLRLNLKLLMLLYLMLSFGKFCSMFFFILIKFMICKKLYLDINYVTCLMFVFAGINTNMNSTGSMGPPITVIIIRCLVLWALFYDAYALSVKLVFILFVYQGPEQLLELMGASSSSKQEDRSAAKLIPNYQGNAANVSGQGVDTSVGVASRIAEFTSDKVGALEILYWTCQIIKTKSYLRDNEIFIWEM